MNIKCFAFWEPTILVKTWEIQHTYFFSLIPHKIPLKCISPQSECHLCNILLGKSVKIIYSSLWTILNNKKKYLIVHCIG